MQTLLAKCEWVVSRVVPNLRLRLQRKLPPIAVESGGTRSGYFSHTHSRDIFSKCPVFVYLFRKFLHMLFF